MITTKSLFSYFRAFTLYSPLSTIPIDTHLQIKVMLWNMKILFCDWPHG